MSNTGTVISSEQQFNRYSISCSDFETALRFAKASQRHLQNTDEYEALLFTAIVSYVRPFSANEKIQTSRAKSRLEPSALGPLTAAELELHEQCMELRNTALAHSKIEMNPTRLLDEGIVASRPFSLLTQRISIEDLIGLIESRQLACHRARADYILKRRREPVAPPDNS